MTRLLLALLCFCAPSLFADEHGRRLGVILAAYTHDTSLEEKLAERKVDADYGDDEMRAVLFLLESYLGPESLKAHIAAKPRAFRHLRLRRLEAYFTLLGVFLDRDQVTEVLRADFVHLKSDDFTEFLTHSSLLKPYEKAGLPTRLQKKKQQRKILAKLTEAIETEGFPLPASRAREIVVDVVADVDELLTARGMTVEPPAPQTELTREALQALVLRLRAVGTSEVERKRIATELIEELPATLRRGLVALFADQLPYKEQKLLHACIDALVGDV